MNPSKNFKLVIQAAQQLPNVKFIIAGGQNSKIFKTNIIEDIPQNVHFVGYVTDEELVALYKCATCFVYPSLYEGFGIPPVEAMSFHCPVIVSNSASLPEVCKDGALYCDPHSPKDLVGKIENILSNRELCESLMQKGEHQVKRYKWEDSARKVLGIF